MATTITPTIVNLNTTVTLAPTASQLQQSGAFVSAGGTTLTAGTYQFCGTLSAVQAILTPPLAITSLVWSSGIVTATVGTLTLAVGQTFTTTIAGATPAGYNGTFVATVATTTTFTYALATNPGLETAPGTYAPPTSGSLSNMATTFFAQGPLVGAYVLELGPQTSSSVAITALGTWITNNPGIFYAYLTPGSWDSAALNTLAMTYNSPSSKTYFFVTTTVANLSFYLTNKAVFAMVPSPTAAATEHQCAAPFYDWLSNTPAIASPAAPMAFRFQYGVTPWAQTGNTTSINTILTDYGNVILTGAEGGISTATLFRGTFMDGNQMMFWYSVDWFQIQVKQQMANAIINGSNSNPPLQYNQHGINALQSVGQNICNSGIAFGLALTASITATPFFTYTQANPSNYAAGIYNGFTLFVTPQLGFESIQVNIDATQFVA